MKPRRAAAVAIFALALPAYANAQPAARCTRETLNVQGTAVTAAYCVAGVGAVTPAHDVPVRVTETYSSPRGSYSGDAVLRFIAGEPDSRVIHDVPLARLGLTGTLHLTLLWRAGLVRVDSAMLTPGAITIK
jgi:hypothetical protein